MEKNLKTIYDSITINASPQKVWEVLLDDSYTKIWYAIFSEGTYAITDWKVGSKAIFTDASNSGLIGKILTNKPAEELTMEYEGVLTDGKEVYDSDGAASVKGGKEKYFLSGDDTETQLSIECDMNAAMYEFMRTAWQKALQKIKALAESDQ